MSPGWLTLLPLASAFAAAQSTGNLTLTFAPTDSSSCATPLNASNTGGITFSTSSNPTYQICINLNDTFASSSSSTGIAYAQNDSASASKVSWLTHDAANYSPSANYSRIWYQQVNATGDVGTGENAARYVTLYPRYGCLGTSGDISAMPDYGYSCQTGVEGRCDGAAYGVASFEIIDAAAVNAHGQCQVFAKEGGAVAGCRGGWTSAILALAAMMVVTLCTL